MTDKKELTPEEAIEKKMSMIDVIKYYAPNVSNEFADYFIWEETCYPMSTEETFKQIYQAYVKGRLQRVFKWFASQK